MEIVDFPEHARYCHKALISGSGGGKSTLMQLMAHDNFKREESCVIIDPHGDLAEECSRLLVAHRGKGKKLQTIYIQPSIVVEGKQYAPRFNPLQIDYDRFPDMSKQSIIALRKDELIAAFEVIFWDSISENMRLMLSMCLQILLEKQDGYLGDLIMMLQPEVEDYLLDEARNHPDITIRNYFRNTFMSKNLLRAKNAVITRLLNAFSNPNLRNLLLVRKSTFSIQRILGENRSIIFNASQSYYGEVGTKILGSFVMAELMSFAMGRARIPKSQRHPVFAYLDEAPIFMTSTVEKILSQARKYCTYITSATQYVAQFRKSGVVGLLDSVLANSAVKIVGKCTYNDRKKLSNVIGLNLNEIPELHTGKFAMHIDQYAPELFQASDKLIRKDRAREFYCDDKLYAQLLKATALTSYHHPPTCDFDLEMKQRSSNEYVSGNPIQEPDSTSNSTVDDDFDSIF